MVVYLISPPFPLTCHLLTRCKVISLKGTFDTSSKAQPASPEGSGRGKRAALRAASFHPRAHLPDICGLRLASRSLAACCDVARAALAQRRPAGCRHGALATQRVTL